MRAKLCCIIAKHYRKQRCDKHFKSYADNYAKYECDNGYLERFKQQKLCDMALFHTQNIEQTELAVAPLQDKAV